MNNYDKIMEIAKANQGFVRSEDVRDKNINRFFLTKMVEKGMIKRISRGYYGLPEYIEDDYYKIISKSKNAIFSMTTALYFHDLSDRTPLIYDVTVPSKYGGSLLKQENIKLYFEKKETFDLGSMEMRTPFNTTIKVYDKERTICDIIKNKNKMDIEIFTNALKKYVVRKDKNLNRLSKYAKALKIEKKLSEYMEILL